MVWDFPGGPGVHVPIAGGMGLIPDWGTKIPCAVQRGPHQKSKWHENCK